MAIFVYLTTQHFIFAKRKKIYGIKIYGIYLKFLIHRMVFIFTQISCLLNSFYSLNND